MKKLAQISLVLFISAIVFSSCEEDTLLNERTQNELDTQSEISTSNSRGSDRFQEERDDRLDRIDESGRSR